MGLFGRKKTATRAPQPEQFTPTMVGDILQDIARAVIGDYAATHASPPNTMSAKIEFDDHQRVVRISQPFADGQPFIPTFEVIERLNEVCAPWGGAPDNGKPRAVNFSYDRGRFSSSVVYPE